MNKTDKAVTDPRTMWRLKLTAHMCDNVYYLRKYDNGTIQLASKCLIPHALSNICENAFELETALEDAYTGFDAASATRKHATYIKKVEII